MFVLRPGNPAQELINLQNADFKTWFKGSKVVDAETGVPLVQYHGTCFEISSFWPFTHFSTQTASDNGVSLSRKNNGMAIISQFDPHSFSLFGETDVVHLRPGMTSGHIYRVFLRIVNPLHLHDKDEYHSPQLVAELCRSKGVIGRWSVLKIKNMCRDKGASKKEGFLARQRAYRYLRLRLMAKGYDGIRYELGREDRGKEAWINFSPAQVRFAFKPDRFHLA